MAVFAQIGLAFPSFCLSTAAGLEAVSGSAALRPLHPPLLHGWDDSAGLCAARTQA